MSTEDDGTAGPADADLPPTRQLSLVPVVGAFVAVVVIVVVTIVLNSGGDRGAPNVPRVDAKNALLCPGSYSFTATRTWVPNNPIGVDVSGGLVPDESPDQVAVCRYAAPTAAAAQKLVIQGRVVLTGDLDKVRSTLVSAKVSTKTSAPGSGAIGTPVYLIGITYPEGTLWVAVDGGSVGNGKTGTDDDLEPYVSSAYRAKTWP